MHVENCPPCTSVQRKKILEVLANQVTLQKIALESPLTRRKPAPVTVAEKPANKDATSTSVGYLEVQLARQLAELENANEPPVSKE